MQWQPLIWMVTVIFVTEQYLTEILSLVMIVHVMAIDAACAVVVVVVADFAWLGIYELSWNCLMLRKRELLFDTVIHIPRKGKNKREVKGGKKQEKREGRKEGRKEGKKEGRKRNQLKRKEASK